MDDKEKKILKKYGQQVGYSEADLEHFRDGDFRVRHITRLAEAATRYSIVAEVVESKHCNSHHRVGDRFVLDVDGNFINKLCPKRMCVYLISQLIVPVAVINERLSEGLDPNAFHFAHYVKCVDVGVECDGYGQVMLRVEVKPRESVDR
jgi:uncharacterized repeat protein (TIGR04076 family)